MPIQRIEHEGEPPDQPHFAMLIDDTGMFVPIAVGTNLLLIEDPKRADKIFPLILAKVSRQKLVFVCGCGDPRCTRKIEYKGSASGWHRQSQKTTAHQRQDDSEQTAITAPLPSK